MDTTRGQETQAHGMDPPPRDRRFEPQVPSRAKRSVTYGVLLGFGALIAGLVIARGLVGYSVSEDGGTFVQDFSSHLMFTRGVLLEGLPGEVGASAYSVETHVRFMSDWTQGATEAVLPFGYSPTMLWLLLPLALVSLPAAYLIWSLLGATAAGSIVLNDRVNWIPGLAFFLTPVAITAIALGQTAVLGTAGVFFLATRTLTDPINQNRLGRGVVLAGILWALGAKPPLAVTGATAMLALGAVGPVVQAVGFTLLGAAVLTPWLGSGWLSDYWALMGTYDRVGANPVFAWSLVPEHMSNLRAFLHIELGLPDNQASGVSNITWAFSLLLILAAGLRKRLEPQWIWALAVVSYLLFCSHVSSTDELVLLVVPPLVVPWKGRMARRSAYLPWAIVLAALFLSPALGPIVPLPRATLFFIEAGLGFWLVFQGLTHHPSRTS